MRVPFALALMLVVLAAFPGARAWGQDPPIPELALWEQKMVTFGAQHCAFLLLPNPDDTRLDHVFYDGQRVFFQIADYTGDASWNDCAQLAEVAYREELVFATDTPGAAQGFRVFTHGLTMDYLRTGDERSREGVRLLTENSAFAPDFVPLANTVPEAFSREVAFTLTSFVHARQLGVPSEYDVVCIAGVCTRERLPLFVDQALGHIDQWFVTQTYDRITPFMVGLTAEALILYYEQVTPDPRIPPALKLAMDWLWANAWMPESEAFWLDTTPEEFNVPAPDLNLLIAPAFAWLYRHYGDPVYRDAGDQIFAGGVRHAFIDRGKQFNQNYRWSFDYVKWRTAPRQPSLVALAPDSMPAGGSAFVLTVNGDDFAGTAVVQWNGASRPTRFVSAQELQADIAAGDLATAAVASVTVENPGAMVSGALSFTVTNPVPVLDEISPSLTGAGGPAFTLTVHGRHFVAASVVRWNGDARPTRRISATVLEADIASADITVGGTVQVTVFNPAPGGGVSAARAFTIETLGVMMGAGRIETKSEHQHFAFSVRQRAGNDLVGKLLLWVHSRHKKHHGSKHHDSKHHDSKHHDSAHVVNRFTSSVINEAVFSRTQPKKETSWKKPQAPRVDTVSFSGLGSWNGQPGYSFVAQATSIEGKRGDDGTFSLTIKSPNGVVVARLEGEISDGHIHAVNVR